MSVTETADRQDQTDRSQRPDSEPEAQSSDEANSPRVSLDVIFDVLRNERRRLVMEAVEEEDGQTTLSDLAEHIGGIENDKPPTALNAQERKRVYVGLYQCHLPRMDDADAIEFDKNRGTVERGPAADAFVAYLEDEDRSDAGHSWPRYYCALSAGGLAAFLLTWGIGSGAEAVPPGAEAVPLAAVLLLILGLSGYHWSHCETE